jgi:PAS domain S-box-containing protein
MNPVPIVKVLLVEDDEDDFILTRDVCDRIRGWRFEVDWVRTYDAGLNAALANRHDVCLVDYRLGAKTGIELIGQATAGGCQSPVILLTGLGEHEVDLAAMRAGAADYLVKSRLEPTQLERAVRYSMERKRAAARAAFDQARIAAFGAAVGLVLTRSDSLEAILESCTRAMEQYLGGALAQISIYDSDQNVLKPHAAAGPLAASMAAPVVLPALPLKPEDVAGGRPMLIKQLLGDSRFADQAWARNNGVVSFAAVPLQLENRLVGLMSFYSCNQLTEASLLEMDSVAHGIALGIERKRSELALNASEGRYRSVVDNIREVVFQMDQFGHWTFLNAAWTMATGFEVTESLHTFFLDFVHHDDRAQNRHIFLELVEQKISYCRYETRFLTKDGKVMWVEVYAQRTHNEDGTVFGISGSLNDFTERKLAEGQIQKLAAFPRVNPNPILEFAADGQISYFNDAARELARTLGKEDLIEILPANPARIAQECLVGAHDRLREQVVVAGRTLTWSFFPIVANKVVHVYGVDITDVVNLEAQFRHAQKLESIGQLAAGVAHDFNNILTVIQGYADLLQGKCKHDANLANPLKQISDASRRASALTRQLLTFSRKQVIQTRVLSLNSVLTNLNSILSRLLGEDIALESCFTEDLPSIRADAGMIEQVVMNLAVNARDAMPKGGQLRVTTSVAEVDFAHAQRQVGARAGVFVALEITDTGSGMSPETLSRIFEPFFSTKEVGKGTGLGLATVYGIVKQHQGWIEVTSEIGRGTAFKVYLPAVSQLAENTGDTSFRPREISGGRQESILLVEDEPVLRELVQEILQSYHYRVIPAGSGVEALRAWDQNDGRIDLLLTDLVMPEGLNGHDLALQLRQRNPALKVLYTSGYSAGVVGNDLERSGDFFLLKPYRPPALAELVRHCLDAKRPPEPKPQTEPAACALV